MVEIVCLFFFFFAPHISVKNMLQTLAKHKRIFFCEAIQMLYVYFIKSASFIEMIHSIVKNFEINFTLICNETEVSEGHIHIHSFATLNSRLNLQMMHFQ